MGATGILQKVAPQKLLTDAGIRGLKPRAKPYEVFDFVALFLTVKPTGLKRWHLTGRKNGSDKLFSISVCLKTSSSWAPIKNEKRSALLGGWHGSWLTR